MASDRILPGDEAYYDEGRPQPGRGFDARLLEEPVSALRNRSPLVFSATDSVSDATREMQRERRGCVLVTHDGTPQTPLIGIFSERDVLYRVIDGGRNPGSLPLGEVMTRDPEVLPDVATLAWVLNKMAVGGFRHVPVVDADGRPAFVISVRDVVEYLVDFFPSEILNLPPRFEATSTEPDGA